MNFIEFINDIQNTDINIPQNIKIYIASAIIFILIISIFILNYSATNIPILASYKTHYTWFIIIAIINLINITIILYYYQYKKTTITGRSGAPGERGPRGTRGEFITCSYCKSNIYSQKTKLYSPIVNFIDVNNTTDIYNNLGYKNIKSFKSRINKLRINPSQISTEMIFKTFSNIIEDYEFSSKNENLLSAIGLLSITDLNNAIGVADAVAGAIYRPRGKVGYLPFGDTAYQSSTPPPINAFLVSGDTRNPVSFTKLITVYKMELDELDNLVKTPYTIWIPNASKNYQHLGEVVSYGVKPPDINDFACLNSNCVYVDTKSTMEFQFIYYTVEKNLSLSFVSFWKTPLNTIITNVATDETIINNSLAFNIVSGNLSYMDNYGFIKKETEQMIIDKLTAINLSREMITVFISIYYISYYSTQLGTYFKSNKIALQNMKENERKRTMIVKINDLFSVRMKEIPYKIDDTKTLYDLLLIIFPEGLNTVVDETILSIQRDFIKLIKVCFEPNKKMYMIKNGCLAYDRIDEERIQLSKTLNNVVDTHVKIVKFLMEREQFKSALKTYLTQFDNLVASEVGHISNWSFNIESGNYDDFTNGRLKTLINIYEKSILYLHKTYPLKDIKK